MSWQIGIPELNDLARGAALLGTGGGGDPRIGRLMAEAAIREHGPVTVLRIDEIPDESLVIPTSQMGAPTVMLEKIPRGTEAVAALRALERHIGRVAQATMPSEIGGINSMIPLVVAAQTGLPVIDADGMGRAFPELQMETFSIYGIKGSPMALAGEKGETIVIDSQEDNARMEWLARGVTIRLGGASHIADYAMSGADVKRSAVPGTLSLALSLGAAIRQARSANTDPIASLVSALAPTQYKCLRVLFRGKVVDVERKTIDGFTKGRVIIRDVEERSSLEVKFQNEYLAAIVDGVVRCVVPDLVCVLEQDTAEPITTERLRFGQRVTVIGIATPEIMRTPDALAVFGPACFGLDYPYTPLEAVLDELAG